MKNDNMSSIHQMNIPIDEIDNYNQENIGGNLKKQIIIDLSIIGIVIIIVIAVIIGNVFKKNQKKNL